MDGGINGRMGIYEVVLDFYFFQVEKRFARMTENGSLG